MAKMDPISKFIDSIYTVLEKPVIFFREKIVEPNQQQYPWYHRKYRRVPTIDECYTDDVVCHFEANNQYTRDKQVDGEILSILRQRHEDCQIYNWEDRHVCDHLYEIYEQNAASYMAKHGDLGAYPNVRNAFMKQKHRMIWERRHGPVGTGMKNQEDIKT